MVFFKVVEWYIKIYDFSHVYDDLLSFGLCDCLCGGICLSDVLAFYHHHDMACTFLYGALVTGYFPIGMG